MSVSTLARWKKRSLRGCLDTTKVKARHKGKPKAEGPLFAYREIMVTHKRAGLYAMPCAAASTPTQA